MRTHPRAEFGTRLCGSTFRIFDLLAGAGIDLRRLWGSNRNSTPYFGTVEYRYLPWIQFGLLLFANAPCRQEVHRLPTPEVVNYNELGTYRARLAPSRVFDHRLSRIERLVLDAYIDMTTIDYVRKEDGKRIGLVNGPYGGTKEGTTLLPRQRISWNTGSAGEQPLA